MNRNYGWKPDVPDHRDHLFALAAPTALPKKVSTLGTKVPIDDQGDCGSCTGNATTAALEIITGAPPLSRLMAYYNGRVLEGTTGSDDGATIRDVIKQLSKLGVSGEPLWPYDVSAVTKKPSDAAYADGLTFVPRIASYQRVTTFAQLRKAIAAHLPVVFGFEVPDYFESDEVATKGYVRLPTDSDPVIGGHAVLAVGYNMSASKPYVIVRNSWGQDWGLGGYFHMAAEWFTDRRRLVDDMWVIRAAK